jgi:hypothetical protein
MRWLTLLLSASCLWSSSPEMSADEVLAMAGVKLPPTATEVHTHGDPGGMDAISYLQFVVPDLATAKALAETAGCAPAPIERLLDDPFVRSDPGRPAWWRSEKHPGALACQTDGKIVRSVRLNPLEDGRVRVQIAAVR